MTKSGLITGGAKRIGREISLFLAKKGYDIALHYNSSQSDAEKTASEIKALGVRCKLFKYDLADLSEVEKLIESVIQTYKKPDILVNNASVFDKADIKNTSTELLSNQLDINFKAPYILTRDFANLCKDGLVVNMIDNKIDLIDSVYSAYTLSKKALADLTRMSATQLADQIRVNAIAPGTILMPNKDIQPDCVTPTPQKSITDILDVLDKFIEDVSLTGKIIYI